MSQLYSTHMYVHTNCTRVRAHTHTHTHTHTSLITKILSKGVGDHHLVCSHIHGQSRLDYTEVDG